MEEFIGLMGSLLFLYKDFIFTYELTTNHKTLIAVSISLIGPLTTYIIANIFNDIGGQAKIRATLDRLLDIRDEEHLTK